MIVQAAPHDLSEVLRLARLLWPKSDAQKLQTDFAAFLADQANWAVFLSTPDEQQQNETPVQALGFAACSLRQDYVNGTFTSPVGYLEGIYVEEARRREGHGKALTAACQAWAKAGDCTEFASDCEIGNGESLAFHLSAGFSEAGRVICFVKSL